LQGGFAKCYELTDAVTKQVFAGKIVPKTLLVKPHQREKVFADCFVKHYCFLLICNFLYANLRL